MRGFSVISRMFRPAVRIMIAGSIAMAGVLAQPVQSSAKDRISPGEAAAIGIVGGLALGAILGNSGRGGGTVYVDQYDGYDEYGYHTYRPGPRAYQPRPIYYAPPPAFYAPPPAYYAPRPYPACFQVQERVWVRGWGWQMHQRTVCE